MLCVDLDGTLIKTDLLWESFLLAVKRQPWIVFLLPVWLARGKACLKRELARRANLDAATLPYNRELLSFLADEKKGGKRLVLATAAAASLARRVFDHIGIFDELLVTEDMNFSGRAKRDVLLQKFSTTGFDYAGNGRADLPVWSAARSAIVVTNSQRFVSRVSASSSVSKVFDTTADNVVRRWARALRLHQWVKNLLVFAPLILSHHWRNQQAIEAEVFAFFAFSLAASATYVMNDLLDLESDRAHAYKSSRPFASGQIPLLVGIILVPVLAISALTVAALTLPAPAAALVGFYFVATALYSLWLKRIALLDVLVLAAMYTLRIFVGAVVIGVPVSTWLLAFSGFFFLSLAMAKRFTELFRTATDANGSIAGRDYRRDDCEVMSSFGTSAGYVSVLVMALYINSGDVKLLYRHSQMLWLVCPILLYWISRIWLLAHRGELRDDPIVAALSDPISLLLGAVTAVLIVAATL